MNDLRILVVEGDANSRETLGLLLEELGASVQLAANAEDALTEANRVAPHVILSDLGLEGTDGFELARRLREHPQRDSMRLVAVTGFAHERERAIAAGFDAFLTKPVGFESIRSLLENLPARP